MKFHNQICTKEQSQKLVDLGVVRDQTIFYHFYSEALIAPSEMDQEVGWGAGTLSDATIMRYTQILPAFNPAELSVMLGKYVKDIGFHIPTFMWSQKRTLNPDLFKTQAECYANYLIWCLENDCLNVKYVNEKLINS